MADIIDKLVRTVKNPFRMVNYLGRRNMLNWMNDELYLKLLFRSKLGYFPHLKKPQTFNEKLQWLKLHDHNPLYTTLVDKYEVRKCISDMIGDQYLIPLLGVWDKFDDIDFNSLPNQFVLKCTHDSGGLVICRDKSEIDINAVRKKFTKLLKKNYYWQSREWPYKNVEPRIIAEKYMENETGAYSNENDELIDYKLMCLSGKVKFVFTCTERFTDSGLKVTFFDMNWDKMPFERHYPASEKEIAKPLNFDSMVELAEQLSKLIPFVRVDFYEISGKLYFGELTFYPGSGFEEFIPGKWDRNLGDLIELPVNFDKRISNN